MRQWEQGAARTRIVGRRPLGSGNAQEQVPRGIEILVKKAAVDPEFRATLHERRAQAARQIDLNLTPAEAAMLDTVPAAQLEAIINRTRVKLPAVPALLGRSAAAMLVALTAFGSGCDSDNGPVKGIQPDRPENSKKVQQPAEPDTSGDPPQKKTQPAYEVAGIRTNRPDESGNEN